MGPYGGRSLRVRSNLSAPDAWTQEYSPRLTVSQTWQTGGHLKQDLHVFLNCETM